MILQNLFLENLLSGSYVVATGILAGGVAAIAGFGIGSLLTPLLSIQIGTKLAIAIVAIPHFVGTAIRFWLLKSIIDKKIFFRFGSSSIVGGLFGALLFWKSSTTALTLIFGIILIFSGLMEFGGFLKNLRIGKIAALIGGFLSGFLGGLVGNQGGIRSAALLCFNLDKKAFVATATAIGLVVDAIRMPIYFATQGREIINEPYYIISTTIGVVIGTGIGIKVLDKIPKEIFGRIIAGLVLLLGILMIYKSIQLPH